MSENELLFTIFAEGDEAAVAEAPSLQEAYEQGTDNVREESSGVRKRERAPREAIPSADTLEEQAEHGRRDAKYDHDRSARVNQKLEPTLSQALSGEEPDDAAVLIEEGSELGYELQGWSPVQIGQALMVLNLTLADVEADSRWIPVLIQQLEASDPEESDDSDEDEPDPETEELNEPEQEKEPEKVAEKKDEPAAPIAHRELLPAEVDAYVERTWAKMEQVSSPQMSKLFSENMDILLSKVPESEEERKAQVRAVCNLGQYGIMSMAQSAMPAMVDEYMQEHFGPNIMRVFSHVLEAHLPGVTASFHAAEATKTWDAVRAENESFADLPDFESPEFVGLRDKIRAANPWIDSWDPDPKMPPLQALKLKAQLFARLALGERVDPKRAAAQIADALQLGKKSAERSTRRVTGSAMRGSGGRRGSSSIGEQNERSGLMDAWNNAHGKGSEGI